MAQIVIYQNRIRRKVKNEPTLEVFCGGEPQKDLLNYIRVYGDIRNVMALACLIPN
jgi:hypothetical protein